MAVHAVDILESAQRVATLPQALQGVLGRSPQLLVFVPWQLSWKPRTALPWLLEEPGTAALILVQNTGAEQ